MCSMSHSWVCAVFVNNDKDRLANWLTNRKMLNELLVTFDIHFKACGQSCQSSVPDPMLEFIFSFNCLLSLGQNIFSALLQCLLQKFSQGSWSSPKLCFLLHLGVSVFIEILTKSYLWERTNLVIALILVIMIIIISIMILNNW